MKKKNKIILVLCCLPILFSCLVLPMCSFINITEVNGYEIYDTSYTVDIYYDYHRVTNGGIDERIYGSIPNFYRMPINKDYGASYNTDMCSSYLMQSNYSLDYSFTFTDFAADTYYAGVDVTLATDNTTKTLIDERITISGNFYSGQEMFSFGFTQVNMTPLEYFECTPSIDYKAYYFDNGDVVDIEAVDWFIDSSAIFSGYYVSVNNVLDYICDYEQIETLYFTYLDIKMNSYYNVENYSKMFSVNYRGNIYDKSVRDQQIEVIRYAYYDRGYSDGLVTGGNNAIRAWTSLDNFLVDALGGFFKTELFPNFTVSTVLGIFVGGLLLVSFLKVFAGG